MLIKKENQPGTNISLGGIRLAIPYLQKLEWEDLTLDNTNLQLALLTVPSVIVFLGKNLRPIISLIASCICLSVRFYLTFLNTLFLISKLLLKRKNLI